MPIFLVCVLCAIPISSIIEKHYVFDEDLPFFIKVMISCFFTAFVWFCLVGELVKKCVKITIDKVGIKRTSFFGLGLSKVYQWTDIDGFIINDVLSRAGSYEYIYLVKRSKRILVSSQFYHVNYKEIKVFLINNGLKKWNKTSWSFLQDLKDVFSI